MFGTYVVATHQIPLESSPLATLLIVLFITPHQLPVIKLLTAIRYARVQETEAQELAKENHR
jgi:hypothetical protein